MQYLDLLRGTQLSTQVPSEHLGNIIQIWEFLQRFSKQLNIDTSFTVNSIYIEMVSPATDLLEYLLSSIFSYTFNELVSQKNHLSNYYQILEQLQSFALRRFLIYQTWPFFFCNLNKITKLRNVLQEDIKEEFANFSQKLTDSCFRNFTVKEKCQFFLFNINWIIYEIESLGTELDEGRDILDEVSSGTTEKQHKQWQNQLRKVTLQLEQSADQLKKERRKQKKNKKLIDQLESQLSQHRQQQRRFTKLLEFNPQKEYLGRSRCSMLGNLEDIQVWMLEFDPQHFYLRNLQGDQDEWYQFGGDAIFSFMDLLDLNGNKNVLVKLQALIENDELSTCTPEPLTITHKEYFRFQDEIETIIENKINLDFLRPLENELDTLERNKQILLELESQYSEYELEYWKCNWTSKERRNAWREKVNQVNDVFDLQTIVSKFPHQLSFVNRKHALEIPSEEQRYKSFRLYWFYQNKSYSQPYQTLSKNVVPNLKMIFVLVLSLYEKLKFYINKKITQIELNIIQKNFTPNNSEQEQVDKDIEEEKEVQPLNRLRQRKNPIVYDESKSNKKQNKKKLSESEDEEINANVKIRGLRLKKQKIVYDESKSSIQVQSDDKYQSTPNLSLLALDEFAFTEQRVLRQRKRVKYNQ